MLKMIKSSKCLHFGFGTYSKVVYQNNACKMCPKTEYCDSKVGFYS